MKQRRHLSSLLKKLSFSDGSKSHLNLPDFTDPAASFKTRSSIELLRGIIVFSICNVRPMVVRSNELLKTSYKYLGRRLTNHVLRLSFFDHFCAGEDEIDIKPKVEYLYNNGIGSILDYAAEADVSADPDGADISAKSVDRTDYLKARVYDYENEALCDARADTFKKCIRAVHSASPTGTTAYSDFQQPFQSGFKQLFHNVIPFVGNDSEGFAAIKVTALGNPILLERMSSSIIELRNLFRQLDSDNKGTLFRKAMHRVVRSTMKDLN